MYVIGVSRTQTLRFRVNVSGIVTSKATRQYHDSAC